MAIKKISSDTRAQYRSQIKDYVFKNPHHFDLPRICRITDVIVGDFRKQNLYSKRAGTNIIILYDIYGKAYQKHLWVKRLLNAQDAYNTIITIYNKLLFADIHTPVPKPYLFDEKLGILIMDQIRGTNLFKLTLAYSIVPNKHFLGKLPDFFFKVGQWLHQFQKAVQTDSKLNMISAVNDLTSFIDKITWLNVIDRDIFRTHLDKIASDPIAGTSFQMVVPHNDFTLRNIFATRDKHFKVIDWDASVHPSFPQRRWCWSDLASLFLNIQSLIRFYPFVCKNKIMRLCHSLLAGYFVKNSLVRGITVDDFWEKILYFEALGRFVGYESDRPLIKMHTRRFTWRYTEMLKNNLLKGRVAIN